MTENAEFVTLRRGMLVELLPLEAALRAEGFHPYIPNRHAAGTAYLGLESTVFNMVVQVPADEAEAAREFLQIMREDFADEDFDDMEDEDETSPE